MGVLTILAALALAAPPEAATEDAAAAAAGGSAPGSVPARAHAHESIDPDLPLPPMRTSPIGLGLTPRLQWPRRTRDEVLGLAFGLPAIDVEFLAGGMIAVYGRAEYAIGMQTGAWIVADDVDGLQVALVAWAGEQEFAGVLGAQFGAALAHTSWLSGVQVGGVVATADDVYGLQVAGVTTYAEQGVMGTQIAGLVARGGDGVAGLQLAALAATTEQVAGVQLAGGFTLLDDPSSSGVQIAGFLNLAQDTLYGAQIGGVGNYATDITGAQVGLVNFAGRLRGVQLGLVNLSRRGGLPFAPFLNIGSDSGP